MSPESVFTRLEGGEYAYTIEATKLKFGVGAIGEIGDDAKALGMTRVALYTDPRVAKLEHVATGPGSQRHHQYSGKRMGSRPCAGAD